MKVAAIFNIWNDCTELLGNAITSMPAHEIIIVWSKYSNRGEQTNETYFHQDNWGDGGDLGAVHYIQCEPNSFGNPHESETRKRNAGLEKAKELGCTHFIICDSDEFYDWDEMMATWRHVDDNNLNGIVHPLKVYVGKPTLWCEDHTLVPGIQKLYPDTQLGNFRNYPFAYDAKGNAHIDPTRRTNQTTGIEMSPFYMHHMSYVRRDIDLKIRNSSANLRRSEAAIKRDIANAAPGYMSELYHRELKESENLFGITI